MPASNLTGAMDKITVVTVSWRSGRMIRWLMDNLRSKAALPDHLRFLIVDNTGGNDDSLSPLVEEGAEVVRHDGRRMQRSVAHAAALDEAMARIQTPLLVVVDPDVFLFQAGWDDWCRSTIASGMDFVGAPYPPWKLGKVHDFPSPVFFVARTSSLRALDTAWTPFPSAARRAANFFLRKVTRFGLVCTRKRLTHRPFLRNVGATLEREIGITSPDTGFFLGEAARRAGMNSHLLEALYADDSRLDGLPVLASLAARFELYFDGKRPFLVHRYSSGVFLWRTGPREGVDVWRTHCLAADRALVTGEDSV